MDKLSIDPTDNSPAIDFDFASGRFVIAGESYPENVAAFFGPIMERFNAYLRSKADGAVAFSFEMIYFNSSTAKVLMEIFDELEEAAVRGVDVTVEWRHDAEDDTMKELGEEFAEDLDKVTFTLVEIEG